MHPFVRDLYRRFLVVSSTPTRGYRELSAFSLLTTAAVRAFGPLLLQVARDYPLPPEECRRRIREGFLRNSHLTGKEDILRAVHHGRYKVDPPTSTVAGGGVCIERH